MKKFGIIVVLAMFAIGVSAQEVNHHPILKGNDATLNQAGWSQWGFIYQFGDGNNATINQGVILEGDIMANHHDWSYGNTAFITQIGFNNDGTINQMGHGNYANLMQMNFGWHHHGHHYADVLEGYHHQPQGATGVINQTGSHNIVSVLQLGGSNLVINQGGKHNVIGGAYGGSSCGRLEHYSYEQSCSPFFWMKPLLVGEGETLELTQDGQGEFFFGIGILKGDRTIYQGNTLGWGEMGYGHHHSHLDYNAIWLSQEGGYANLSQNGRYNRILLDIDVEHHNSPEVYISQTGYKNVVAKFNGPCDNCTTQPAEFNGDEMNVVQNGYKNKLSIDSDGMNNNINVTQNGMFNFGMIVQRGIQHHSQFNTYCAGCQQ